MYAAQIAILWPVEPPCTTRRLDGGINNLTHWVDSPSGSHVLRIYQNSSATVKIGYEMALLTALSPIPLSFAVPAPIATRAGGPLARMLTPDGERLAILTPVIPGGPPDHASIAHAQAAGRSLGELTAALGTVRLDAPNPGTYGGVLLNHPLMADPEAAVQLYSPELRPRLLQVLRRLSARVGEAYAALPQQPIHGDFVPFNLLMAGDRVTGILDFEFGCNDLRLMDLASLFAWPSGWTGEEWPYLDAISEGYSQFQRLSPDEAEALPLAILLRRAVNFIFWTDRHLRQDGPPGLFQQGAERLLQQAEWLERNGAELSRRVRGRW